MNKYLEKIALLRAEKVGKALSNVSEVKEVYERRKKKKKKVLEAKTRRFNRGTVRKNS